MTPTIANKNNNYSEIYRDIHYSPFLVEKKRKEKRLFLLTLTTLLIDHTFGNGSGTVDIYDLDF